LPFAPLTARFVNVITIPLGEIRDDRLVVLQNERHRAQALDRVLHGKPESIGVKISRFGLMPKPVSICKPLIDGGQRAGRFCCGVCFHYQLDP